MYLQRSNVYDRNVAAVQGMLNAALATDRYRGKWSRLVVDGYYGIETEKAVRAFQYNHNPRIAQTGIVGDTTYNALRGTVPVMSAASPTVFLRATAPSTVMVSARTTSKKEGPVAKGYNATSETVKVTAKVKHALDPSEKGLAFVIGTWDRILTEQYEGLLRRLNKFPAKKAMRTRNIMRQMERCKKFLEKAKRYGIVSATTEFKSQLSKEEAIRTIKEMSALIKESSLTKSISAISKSLSKVKSILRPFLNVIEVVFKKVPGLKYLSVIEKFCKGTKLMIEGDYENAFAVFMDALRELLEQVLIDVAVAALVAAGGWIALVVAIIVIIAAFLIDYFFFSDNPGDSLSDKYLGVKTRNIMLQEAPKTHRILTNGYY